MDIGSAFTFMFDDDDWVKKLAIGGGLAFIGLILSPILVGFLLLMPLAGYMIEVLRNVRDGYSKPLPEWSDFGGLFKTGLFVTLIGFVYYIPVILLSCGAAGIQMLPELAEMDPDAAAPVVFAAICLNCLQIILGLVIGLIMPAALIRYAQYDTFGSAFQFGELFAFIRNNIGDYIIAVLLTWVASLLAGFGIILCFVGVFFTFFWSYLVNGNLYGQLARKAQGMA